MEKEALENELRQILREAPALPNESHLARTLLLAEREAKQRQNRSHISFARFLQKQIAYIGWKVWGMQGIFLLLAVGLFSDFSNYLVSPLRLAKLLFCLSVAVLMTALPLLYRCVRCRMQEIEAATRFSSVKLLLAKLIVVGIGDLVLLFGIFLTAAVKTSLPAGSIVFYLVFPFLLSGSGCLFLLRRLSSRAFFTGSLALGASLIVLFSVLPERCALYLQSVSPAVWMTVCALLFACCAVQIRDVVRTSSYTETQLA